jgi:serine protease Do
MAEDKPYKRGFRKPLGYLIAVVSAAVLSVGIFAGTQYFAARRTNQGLLDNPAAAESKVPASDPGVSQLKQTSESFRQVAKMIGPAVVNIKSTKAARPKNAKLRRGGPGGGGRRGAPAPEDSDPFGGGGGGGEDPFYDFFQRFGHPFMQPDTPQTSLGSGFIIDKKGYVVTNNHVVEDASEILVSLSNDRTDLKAKVIGTDPKTDLALLKIDTSKDLPVAEWADSDTVEVGDWAVAIGSPFDLRQTVTVGIVSAKGRSSNVLAGAEYVGELIQTDAAINPGNSGGPLCTLEGKIMGVNTAIYTRSGGYMGIGFAIPSNLAKDVVNKLRTDGKIIRGWLGVYIQPLDPEMATKMGVKDGVGIHEVIDGSPAGAAGLKAGDVVLEIEGKPVKEVAQLQRIISNFKPGQSVKMKVTSFDKKVRNVTVKIGVVPAEAEAAPKVSQAEEENPDKLGLVVGEPKGKEGVVVQAVQPGSIGEGIGLEPGDLVTKIEDTETKSVAAYKKAVKAAKGLTNIWVKEKGKIRWFSIPIGNE